MSAKGRRNTPLKFLSNEDLGDPNPLDPKGFTREETRENFARLDPPHSTRYGYYVDMALNVLTLWKKGHNSSFREW